MLPPSQQEIADRLTMLYGGPLRTVTLANGRTVQQTEGEAAAARDSATQGKGRHEMSKATGTDLVRKDSIEELCGHRARALQLYRQALDTLDAAMAAHKLACAGGHTSNDFLRDFHYTTRNDKFDAAAQKAPS